MASAEELPMIRSRWASDDLTPRECLSELTIRTLELADTPTLSRLLTADAEDYQRYFAPFDTSAESLSGILAAARRDRYWGIVVDGKLVGLIMLRGFDEGYRVPAFGVFIAQAYSGKRLAKLALGYAEAWSRLSGCEAIMLSVHPDNVRARLAYERDGFQFTGEHSRLGHRVYRKALSPA